MKRSMIFTLSSLVSVLSLAGCIGGDADMTYADMNDAVMTGDEEIGDVAQAQLLCVTPPTYDATVVQSHSDVNDHTSVDSPDGSYYLDGGYYVVEVTGMTNTGASERTARARGTDSASSEARCENTTTTATPYGFDEGLGCWVQFGSTKSKLGVYHPASGGYPAYCDDQVIWNIPASVTKVRIKGKSVQQMWIGMIGQKITEGTHWVY